MKESVALIVVPLMVTVELDVRFRLKELLIAVALPLKKLVTYVGPFERLLFDLAFAVIGELAETAAKVAASAAANSFVLTIDAKE